MQDAPRISVDLKGLLKVGSTGVSVGLKPSEKTHNDEVSRRIAVDLDTLLKVSSIGVAVGTKPGPSQSSGS